jgi:FKBP12-rapamycin complex-associated protein
LLNIGSGQNETSIKYDFSGRLSILNPAYIMPSLRKTLLQLLTELEHSGVGRNKEHSAQLLGHLVANAPTLICPYVEPILNVLVKISFYKFL